MHFRVAVQQHQASGQQNQQDRQSDNAPAPLPSIDSMRPHPLDMRPHATTTQAAHQPGRDTVNDAAGAPQSSQVDGMMAAYTRLRVTP